MHLSQYLNWLKSKSESGSMSAMSDFFLSKYLLLFLSLLFFNFCTFTLINSCIFVGSLPASISSLYYPLKLKAFLLKTMNSVSLSAYKRGTVGSGSSLHPSPYTRMSSFNGSALGLLMVSNYSSTLLFS